MNGKALAALVVLFLLMASVIIQGQIANEDDSDDSGQSLGEETGLDDSTAGQGDKGSGIVGENGTDGVDDDASGNDGSEDDAGSGGSSGVDDDAGGNDGSEDDAGSGGSSGGEDDSGAVGGGDDGVEAGTDTTSYGPGTWTVIFIMGYDNDLEGFWDEELSLLENIGPPRNGHFILLVDLEGDNDTEVLHIQDNGTEEIPLSDIDPSWGTELNTGDGAVLEEFIVWSMETYPSDHYHLFISTHGGGWIGFCPDDTSGDMVEAQEARTLFNNVKARTGRPVDVLSFYACIMANLEFAYEVRESVNYITAAQTLMAGDNLDYGEIWGGLKENPEWDPEHFALHLMDAFESKGPAIGPSVLIFRPYSFDTYSVLNLSGIGRLATVLGQLSKELYLNVSEECENETMNERELILEVIGDTQAPPEYNTESFSGENELLGVSFYSFFDIVDFVHRLGMYGQNLCSHEALLEVEVAIGDVVMDYTCGDDYLVGEHPDAHGIHVYIPCRGTEYRDEYDFTSFAADTNWDEFLKSVYWLDW